MKHPALLLLAGLANAVVAQSPQSQPEARAAHSNNPYRNGRSPTGPLPGSSSHSNVGPAPPEQVVFDRPENDGDLWALGRTWKASFDDAGMTLIPFFGSDTPQNYPIRVELERASVGGVVLDLRPGSPRQESDAVHTQRGALVEVLDLSLHQVEQSFVFDRLPNRGAVRVRVRLQTELSASVAPSGVAFENEHGTAWYRKAIAIDAAGETQELEIVWRDHTASIEIPAAFVERAQLPLVLDPIIDFNLSLAPNVTRVQSEPDVATLQSPDRICTVWRRRWSLGDEDCFAIITDADLAPIRPAVAIDFTSQNWLTPAIASSANARNFLIVSQVSRPGIAPWIRGRLLNEGGTTRPNIDIEGNGVGNLAGPHYRPDVGGDPYLSTQAFYCVAWEHPRVSNLGLQNEIYTRLIDQQGLVTTPNAKRVAQQAIRPSVSKSNGTFYWLVSYEYQGAADLGNRFVTWNGNVHWATFNLPGNTGSWNLTYSKPKASSPAFIDGEWYWAVANESRYAVSGRQAGVRLTLLRPGGWGPTAIYGTYLGPPQKNPDVDSDGSRFILVRNEHSNPRRTLVATQTLSRTGYEEVIDRSVAGEIAPRVCSMRSGGGLPSSRSQIVNHHVSRNDIELRTFIPAGAGFAGGANGNSLPSHWSSTGNQCGNLTMAPSGIPTPGGTVAFDIQGAGPSGIIVGTPSTTPLTALGCNCTLGVGNGTLFPGAATWTVPANPNYLGTTLAVQAWTLQGTNCLGTIDLSDTVTFTIR